MRGREREGCGAVAGREEGDGGNGGQGRGGVWRSGVREGEGFGEWRPGGRGVGSVGQGGGRVCRVGAWNGEGCWGSGGW